MLVIFPTVHWTLCAEKVLVAQEIIHQVVPVPPYVNEGCGLGIELDSEIRDQVLALFKDEDIAIEKVIEKP